MSPALSVEPPSALLRLQDSAGFWDPAGRALLDDLALPDGARVLEVGRGGSALPAGAFDLVRARFRLAPLGRAAEQLAAYRRLLKPGGVLVVEEPDTRTWTFAPHAPAATHLVGRIAQAYRAAGGDLDAGRHLAARLRADGLAPHVRTHAIGLEAGHPHLRLPLDLADALRERLEDVLGRDGLAALRREAAHEIEDEQRTGTTLTLVQAWARVEQRERGPQMRG
jgi:SAM-dependent methyltransferase